MPSRADGAQGARRFPARPHALALALILSMLTGCYTDRTSEAVANGEGCAASARLVDALVETQGQASSQETLRLRLEEAALAFEQEGAPQAAGPAQELMQQLPDERGALDPEGAEEWAESLDDLDDQVAELCGFSIQVLVASRTPALDSALADLNPDDEDSDLLDWNQIKRLIPDAEWIDLGYEGVVGHDPGIFVTVYGASETTDAEQVCIDILDALEEEAQQTEVQVSVYNFTGSAMLANSAGGSCSLGVIG